MKPLPCPRCGDEPTFGLEGYSIACNRCYDWAPDQVGSYEQGIGRTPELAIKSWNESVEDYDGPRAVTYCGDCRMPAKVDSSGVCKRCGMADLERGDR